MPMEKKYTLNLLAVAKYCIYAPIFIGMMVRFEVHLMYGLLDSLAHFDINY